MSGTRELERSAFAAFLKRGDVLATLHKNIKESQDNKAGATVSRLFNDIPPKDSPYELITPLLEAAIYRAIENGNNDELADLTPTPPPSIENEVEAWTHLVYLTAIVDLFDNKNQVRQPILDQIDDINKDENALLTSLKTPQKLLAAYLLVIGQHIPELSLNEKIIPNQKSICYITQLSNQIENQRKEIENDENFSIETFRKKCHKALYQALLDNEGLSLGLTLQIENILLTNNTEYYDYLVDKYENVRTKFIAHLHNLSETEHVAKNNVLDIADQIIIQSDKNPLSNKAAKLKMMVDVLEQTLAYNANADDNMRAQYSKLIQEVSYHAWGKRLAGAMCLVAAAALITTCVLFSLATAGVAIPFIAGLSFTWLVGVGITSGGLGIGALAASSFTLWEGFKHKKIADAMKEVRDRDISETTEPTFPISAGIAKL